LILQLIGLATRAYRQQPAPASPEFFSWAIAASADRDLLVPRLTRLAGWGFAPASFFWKRSGAAALLFVALSFSIARPAGAQSTINNPGDRPDTTLELEPHLLLGPFDPPGPGPGSNGGFGGGVRASFEIVRDGFLRKLNDSVSLGLGLDLVEYGGDARGRCEVFGGGLNQTQICEEVDAGDPVYYLVPLVMQWNFWLSRRWSVFGEPGLMLRYRDDDLGVSPFVLYAGGRLHFGDNLALTLRIGYPTFSLGVSFLF
jgi:hypothetical protein